MKIHPTPLKKAITIDLEPDLDDRGFFARSFCKKTLEEYGISFEVAQCNLSYSKAARTLRGMHYQKQPFCEDKIVSCVRGAVYDVIIDLNRNSPTFCHWFGVELSSENHNALYVPKGFAHGYQTLTDNATVYYMVSQYYTPACEAGVRWDDKVFGIDWIFKKDLIISFKDRNWKKFNPETDGVSSNEDGDHSCMQKPQ